MRFCLVMSQFWSWYRQYAATTPSLPAISTALNSSNSSTVSQEQSANFQLAGSDARTLAVEGSAILSSLATNMGLNNSVGISMFKRALIFRAFQKQVGGKQFNQTC